MRVRVGLERAFGGGSGFFFFRRGVLNHGENPIRGFRFGSVVDVV